MTDLVLNPDLTTPRAPWLWPHEVPKEQESALCALLANLNALQRTSENFVSAMALYEFALRASNLGEMGSNWRFLAAREGAMMLRNYKEILEAARGFLAQVPFYAPYVRAASLRQVLKDFRTQFPRVEKLRHSVAHPELYADPDVDMSYSGEAKGVKVVGTASYVLQESLMGHTFQATINGILVAYELGGETSYQIVQFTKRVFEAFDSVDGHNRVGPNSRSPLDQTDHR